MRLSIYKTSEVAAIVAAILLLGPQPAHARPGSTGLSHFRSLLEGDEPEWGGSFTLSGDSHTWHMQQVGCEYADPSMKLVFFKTTDASKVTMDGKKTDATTLMNGNSCTDVEAGGTISSITTSGNCYNLKVGTGSHSKYIIDTTNVEKMVVYAQHVPTEFEDTQHYLTVGTAETDVEPAASTGAGHHHHAKQSCACAALEHGFTIDCTNKAKITAAIDYLMDNNSTCKVAEACPANTAECKKEYLHLMAHHDHCAHDQIPSNAEKGIHDYEAYYAGCAIHRKYNKALADCPALTTTCALASTLLSDAITDITSKNCISNCAGSGADAKCKELYQTILMAHDNCDHDDLPTTLEKTLHDMEESCESVLCNTASAPIDLTCPVSGTPGTFTSLTNAVIAATIAAMMLAAA